MVEGVEPDHQDAPAVCHAIPRCVVSRAAASLRPSVRMPAGVRDLPEGHDQTAAIAYTRAVPRTTRPEAAGEQARIEVSTARRSRIRWFAAARRRKTIEISVRPAEGVRVSAPAFASRAEVAAVVAKRAHWILARLATLPPPSPALTPGSSVPFRGEQAHSPAGAGCGAARARWSAPAHGRTRCGRGSGRGGSFARVPGPCERPHPRRRARVGRTDGRNAARRARCGTSGGAGAVARRMERCVSTGGSCSFRRRRPNTSLCTNSRTCGTTTIRPRSGARSRAGCRTGPSGAGCCGMATEATPSRLSSEMEKFAPGA